MSLRSGFTLGDWTVFPLEGRFRRDDESRRVQPKSMDVLLCLAEAAGEVVERDELLRQIWGERAVSDEPLTRCIGELRRALGDARGNPDYILTVPKRGYRLLQPAVPLPDRSAAEDSSNAPPLTSPQRALRAGTIRKLAYGLGALVLAALVQVVIERMLDEAPSFDELATSDSTGVSQSVAVLPFADMTPAQDQAWFGEGLAEELINLLAQNPALRVAARTSSFSFGDNTVPVQEIAQQLNVRHLIEGSIRRDGERIRITAQLIEADGGFHIWSETFNVSLDDIFSIQDRISRDIASALEVSVLGEAFESTRTHPETYALFLQAKHTIREGSREALERAVVFLQEGLEIDPEYAPAWALLSNVYSNLAGQGHWDWDEGFAQAREAATRAVAADPAYSGGYQRLAWVAHRYDGDLGHAFDNMQKALAINSLDTGILRNAAVLLLQTGQQAKAIAALEYCVRRSPMDPDGMYNLGVAYKYADRLEDAEKIFRRILELRPDYNGAEYQLAVTLMLTGRSEESLEIWKRLPEHRAPMGIAMASFDLGREEESRAALAALIEGWGEQWPDTVADVHAWRGELDEAFAWLEKDFEKYGVAGWGEFKQQRLLDNLRSDPRWQVFLERAGATAEALSKYDLALDLPAE